MNEMELTMKTGTLKHIVGVLEEADNKGMFNIDAAGITCTILDPANALMATATIPAATCKSYKATGSFKAGIDLEWLRKMLDIAPAAGGLTDMRIHEDGIHIHTGPHRVSTKLIALERMRKPPKTVEGDPAVSVGVSGWFLRKVAEYLDATKAAGVIIETSGPQEVAFVGLYEPKRYHEYVARGDWLMRWHADACSMYSLYYLVDIVKHLEDEAVTLRFASDAPLRIGWTHDGCGIEIIIAPRIESD